MLKTFMLNAFISRMHNGELASIHSSLQQAFLTAEAAKFADEVSCCLSIQLSVFCPSFAKFDFSNNSPIIRDGTSGLASILC
jgi:hypothetical protein